VSLRLGTLSLLVGAALLGGAPAAHAQDERDSASARALFEEGVKLAKVPDWTQAADRFERSLELRRSPVVAWNLATAWIELGRLVEASELLREIVRDEKAKKPLKKDAEKVLAEIEPRIGKLTVSVAKGSEPPPEVRVDDRALAPASIGAAMPADPGQTRVTALRDGNIVFDQTVTIASGGSQTVEIALRALGPKPTPAPVVVPTPEETARSAPREEPAPYAEEPYEEPEESDSIFESPIFWVAAGVLVAGGVVTAVLVASSSDTTEKPIEGSLGRFEVAR
jgi:hypothetical protein